MKLALKKKLLLNECRQNLGKKIIEGAEEKVKKHIDVHGFYFNFPWD